MASAPPAPSFTTTLTRSAAVLSRPTRSTFAAAAAGGTFLAATRYVALAAFIAALFVMRAGTSVLLGQFLTNLLGFAAFVWLVHRMSESGETSAPLGPLAYVVALFWAPITVITSAVIALLMLTGLGLSLAPLVALAALLVNLTLTFLALGALMPGAGVATRVALVFAGGLAAYGIDRFVWLLVG